MAFRKNILLRARIAFLAVFFFAAAIIGRLLYIQVFQGHHWERAAQATRLKHRPIKATRGNIYGANGSLLATSLPFYRVALDACVVDETNFQKHIVALSERLASFYKDKSAAAYQRRIQKARQAKQRYLILNKKQISYQDRVRMEQWPIFCLGRFRGGVIFNKVEKRFQPFRGLAARTIGYVNTNQYGAGLEYSFNPVLRGTDGQALYQKIVGGKWKMVYNGSVIQPIHGYDLETTIDINLQDTVHNSLLKVLKASQADHGCVIVMEVKTGEIKAIVNLSRVAAGKYREQYNYALGNHGTTEPGSTIKLASMLALLEETDLELTDTVDTGNGRYRFHDRIMKDVRPGGYGELTIQEVFEKSSNIGVARLVNENFGHAPQKFVDYLGKLNLDKPLGMRMIGEGKPLIRTPKNPQWNGTTLPWMSIGYAMQVTPLHTLSLYNAIANDGVMVKPVLVKEIKQANRKIKTLSGTVLNKKICSNATLKKLKIMLEGVVQRGTARSCRHSFYKIAGKSGTANKVANGGYTGDTYISFAGYFPAEAPRYSCIVVVDKPQGYAWHFGGSMAPVVKDIADKIAGQDLAARALITQEVVQQPKGIFPFIKAGHRKELYHLCNFLGVAYQHENLQATWIRSAIVGEKIAWQDNGQLQAHRVPHVRGMTLKNALFLLESSGLKVTIQGNKAGRVLSQSLLPGIKAPGKAITIKMH